VNDVGTHLFCHPAKTAEVPEISGTGMVRNIDGYNGQFAMSKLERLAEVSRLPRANYKIYALNLGSEA
jgi:hypothetical protein